jgi:hypothetical protein
MMNQRDNKSQHFILTGATRMPLKWMERNMSTDSFIIQQT